MALLFGHSHLASCFRPAQFGQSVLESSDLHMGSPNLPAPFDQLDLVSAFRKAQTCIWALSFGQLPSASSIWPLCFGMLRPAYICVVSSSHFLSASSIWPDLYMGVCGPAYGLFHLHRPCATISGASWRQRDLQSLPRQRARRGFGVGTIGRRSHQLAQLICQLARAIRHLGLVKMITCLQATTCQQVQSVPRRWQQMERYEKGRGQPAQAAHPRQKLVISQS